MVLHLEVARHVGGYLPFEADVTDLVEAGQEFRLTIGVNNELTMETIPPGVIEVGADGTRRFHMLGEEPVWIEALAGTYAYIGSEDLRTHRIVDTTTGKLLAAVRTAKPTTIAPARTTY